MRLIEHTPKRWAEHLKLGRPIAETIIPTNPKGTRRIWASMSDRWIVSFARYFIMSNGITSKGKLSKADPVLYSLLRKKNLTDCLGLEDKKRPDRDWNAMTDAEIVEYAMKFIEDNSIKSKKELRDADSGLHEILRKRKLFGFLGYVVKSRRPRRNWRDMGDSELIMFARKFIERNRITSKNELQMADAGMYHTLFMRKLISQIGLEDHLRRWKQMSDKEVIDYAERFGKTSGITSWKQFREGDPTLYGVLRKRGLLDSFGFGATRKVNRDWASVSDEKLVEVAKKFIAENNIKGRRRLEKADSGLYTTLKKKGLLDAVGLKVKRRNWSAMSDEELVEYAMRFIEKHRTVGRKELRGEDNGLYCVLQQRKLLDQAFFQAGVQNENDALQQISDAMSEFSDD
jgi:hypothetical protein